MAQTENRLKRPHPESTEVTSPKRSRSNNGSPAPMPSEQKPDVSKILADAKAKIAARLQAARLQSQSAPATSSSDTASASASAAPAPATSAADRLAQLRARVNAAIKTPSSETRSSSSAPHYQSPREYNDDFSRATGGLGVGLHPRLTGDSEIHDGHGRDKQNVRPRYGTGLANSKNRSETPPSKNQKNQLDLSGPSLEEATQSPFFDPSHGTKKAVPKPRPSRQLIFNEHGKFMAQAAALRRQAALEDMKRRLAESARKAGLDEELDAERAFKVEEPPEIEWWDEVLVDGKSYEVIDDPTKLKIDTEDSIITVYIQHPIMIQPPQDKKLPAPKPMYMTAKEMAKQRRQRRMAEQKEEQAKIRLGLKPAPPPKVKKSNLMRVLGEQAVKDPTAVEARVNREIQERLDQHLQTNEERKLTKEQRLEKLATNQEKDAAKGVYCNVYKIDNLSNGRHRFKISKNADQNALTGICIMHPKLCLVIIEGGIHSVSAYKKLMLNRIDWTENSPSIVREGNQEVLKSWLMAEDEAGELKDLALNKCTLLWEGEVKNRNFKKWSSKVCETDAAAKETLTWAKMESFWTLAKNTK
jgi:U4/U6 small nuclear ribonucleoprotein PRP3